jgi:hypothetical protein
VVTQTKRWLYSQAIRVPLVHPWITNNRFRLERRLIAGTHRNVNTHRSIIHFSVNKAATQYTKGILRRCAIENGLTHAQINEYARHSDFPYLDHLSATEMVQYQHIFKPSGYLYSVFGGMIEGIPNLDNYHVILMIRDPRDVLTSRYFSHVYSHLPPGRSKIEAFDTRVAFAQQAGIDRYVLEWSDQVCQIYQRYLDLLVNRQSNVYVTKYEHMMSDFPTWLDGVLDYCELDISSNHKQDLLEEAYKTRPKKENVSKHARQATPGDHIRKLQPETVEHLDALFSNILAEFGYR